MLLFLHNRYPPYFCHLSERSQFVRHSKSYRNDSILKMVMFEFGSESIPDLIKFFVNEKMANILGWVLLVFQQVELAFN